MPLSQEQLGNLETHLRECVVRLDLRKGPETVGHGTGFFISPGLVMTCRHVVEPAVDRGLDLVAVTEDGRDREAQARKPLGQWPDLALVDVKNASEVPCVLLQDERIARDARLILVGFPTQTNVAYQAPSVYADGEAFEEDDERALNRKVVKVRWNQIEPGMSGGPAVNADLGVVCGVTRTTKGKGDVLGGFVIPIEVAMAWSAPAKQAHDRPGASAREWISILGRDGLTLLGRDEEGGRGNSPVTSTRRTSDRIDLELNTSTSNGDLPRRWKVGISFPPDAAVAPAAVGLPELGDDLIEALDRWSRRRPLSNEDEVNLLGRVLGRALLPDAVKAYLEGWLPEAKKPLVRLRVDPGRLAEIPWEYATLDADTPLGANERFAFSRYVGIDRSPRDAADKIAALLIVSCPPDLQKRLTPVLALGRTVVTPPAEKIVTRLTEIIKSKTNGRVDIADANVVVNPDIQQLKQTLAETSADIVHFVGFGRSGPGGAGEFAATNVKKMSVWYATRKLLEEAQRDPPLSLLIVNLLVPPPGEATPPLTSASLVEFIGPVASALVATQHPAPLDHIEEFTAVLYENIASGQTVERSVEAARRNLFDVNPLEDCTAFGMFSVTTSFVADHQLLKRPVPSGGSGPDRDVTTNHPAPPQHTDDKRLADAGPDY